MIIKLWLESNLFGEYSVGDSSEAVVGEVEAEQSLVELEPWPNTSI